MTRMARSAALLATTALLVGTTTAPAAAVDGEPPLSVVYGPKASTAEGDSDFREVLLVSVPAGGSQPLFLRVFDADTGGAHDTIAGGRADTVTRFTVYGGDGASVLPTDPSAAPTASLVARRDVGDEPAFDGRWATVVALDPRKAETVGDRAFFRLEVEGVAGNDGNVLTVAVSERDTRQATPAGLRIEAVQPTVRVPDKRGVTQLAFALPAAAETVTVRNFDAAAATIRLETGFGGLPVAASGQNEWREATLTIPPEWRGGPAALTIARGDEMPNDVTIEVLDSTGRAVPMQLPASWHVPNNRPVAAAVISPLATCRSVAFDASPSTDPDGDRLEFAWDFGDSSSAAGKVAVHEYAGPGTYTARLRVSDSSGMIGNGAEQLLPVLVKRQPTAVAGPGTVVAPGEVVAFDGSASLPGEQPLRRWRWDFGDGATAEGQQVRHRFDRLGIRVVRLRVDDGSNDPCGWAVAEREIVVNAPPVGEAGADQTVAVDATVQLDGGRSYDVDGRIASWSWDLGDGTTASGPKVEHRYTAPGSYVVRLTVEDDSGVANGRSVDSVRITVNAPPVADAGPERQAAVGEVLVFDGSGSRDPDGRIVDYAWEFGDGGAGEGVRTEYAYRRPGTYTVRLSVRDDSGTPTAGGEAWATVRVNAPPVADAGPDQIVTASEVRFDGSGSRDPDGSIASWSWDFGDGTTGEGPNPVHIYERTGSFIVGLVVTDDSGTARSTDSDSLRVVVNALPVADAGPDRLAVPGEILVFDGGGSLDPDGDVVRWTWDFGDGETASGPSVEHVYARPGAYQVRLEVQDDTGHATAIDHDEARVVINAAPVAVAGPDLRVAPGDIVTVDADGSFDPDGTIKRYRWTFGDGSAEVSGRQVTHAFAEPGVYRVRLQVTDDSGIGNATTADELIVRVNHAPEAVAGEDIRTAQRTIMFDAGASVDPDGDPLTFRWAFGDGTPHLGGARVTHTYAEGGVYPVTLEVDDGSGLGNARARDALTVTINRAPVAMITARAAGCTGDTLIFDGGQSVDPDGGLLRYRWDFGDGTGSDLVNPTKVYTRPGLYPVTLTVEDEAGLANSVHADRIAVRVDASPSAVAGPDQEVCAGTEVRFDGSGSEDGDGVVNRFSWNFGDGNSGGGEKPVHVFANEGDYRVVLTITGDDAGQCDNTDSDELRVRVLPAATAAIDGPDRVAAGVDAVWDGTASRATAGRIVGWRWDMGDGTMAEGPEVTHRYAEPGRYLVTLAIDSDAGPSACRAAVLRRQVLVNAAPVADPGGDRMVSVGEEILFDASASRDPDGALTRYAWDLGDGNHASGVQVRHRYAQPGGYAVALTVVDDSGITNDSNTATVTVSVEPAPLAIVEAPRSVCVGEPLQLALRALKEPRGVDPKAFAWSFGDGAAAQGTSVRHSFAAPGTYPVSVAVDDRIAGVAKRSAGSMLIAVNRPPLAASLTDRVVCPGEAVVFDGGASMDPDGSIVAHEWEFGDGNSASGARVEHRFASPGTYPVVLRVTDNSGSACAVTESRALVRVNASPSLRIDGDRTTPVGGAHDRLRLDAAATVDPDDAAVAITWDLGDGTTLAGAQIAHAYTKPGQYTVKVTASDPTGLACGRAVEELSISAEKRS